MPYAVKRVGSAWQVVNADTGEIHAKHTTKAKAEAQVRLLEGEVQGKKPDKVKKMSNGTTANIYYKNQESYSGAN